MYLFGMCIFVIYLKKIILFFNISDVGGQMYLHSKGQGKQQLELLLSALDNVVFLKIAENQSILSIILYSMTCDIVKNVIQKWFTMWVQG